MNSNSKKHETALRMQIPVKLAFSLTIHKAQGQTLESVVVDLKYCFSPGQINVAISRVRNPQSLTVLNFSKFKCLKPVPQTTNYLNSPSKECSRDLSCCRCRPHTPGNVANDDDNDCDDDDDNGNHSKKQNGDDWDDIDDSVLVNSTNEIIDDEFKRWQDTIRDSMFLQKDNSMLPFPPDLPKIILDKIQIKAEASSNQNAGTTISYLKNNPTYQIFCRYLWNCLCDLLLNSTKNLEDISTSTMTNFQMLAMKFWTGTLYKTTVITLFQNSSLTKMECLTASDTLSIIKTTLLKKAQATQPTEAMAYEEIQVPEVNVFGQSRIRYLAGRSIYKNQLKVILFKCM